MLRATDRPDGEDCPPPVPLQPRIGSQPGAGPRNLPLAATAVIADDHPLVLEGLTHLLRTCAIDVVRRCSTGAELLESVAEHQPHLAILDVRISEPDGLSVLREMRRRGLQVPVIFVTGHLHDHELLEGVRLGIRGLVPKDAPLHTVADCVRTVLAGGTCLDQSLVGRALAALLTREAALRELAEVLTAREVQVVQMVVSGARTRAIAERLGVSEGTIKVHLHHIYEKLNVSSRDELIAYARHRGLL
jgi:two-component system, NarL family, nitrate/nitrite response regulator NarL